MFSKYLRKIKAFALLYSKLDILPKEENGIKNAKVLTGRMLANLNNHIFKEIDRLSEVEFQVYSQWGDDGIIQWLINKIEIQNKTFIEFGVENYLESNTRFLLVNNNWEGLVLDGSENNIKFIKNDGISYAHHIHARHAFITKSNINALLTNLPFTYEVGILSIDIDGNDYWIWKELNVINPIIVIIEYNAHFKFNPWTIPYKEDFIRETGNFKMNFWGVGLTSICDLADEKGYYFIGCNSAGNNAYFVRKDKIADIRILTAEEGYEYAKYRETKDEKGNYVSDGERLLTLKEMEVFNTRNNSLESI